MSIPTTKARNLVPGDTVRIITRAAVDTQGRTWKRGEAIIIMCAGFDNEAGRTYMQTSGGARFLAD